MKKSILIGAVLLALAVPTAVLAASVGGGTWNYGVGYTGTYGYSNYYHPSRLHSGTVVNGKKKVIDQQYPGVWAKASITKIPPTGMSYYWNVY